MTAATRDVVIFGLSDFATLVAGYFRRSKTHRVVAFTADGIPTTEWQGLPLIEFSALTASAYGGAAVFSTVGYRSMRSRVSVYERIRSAGFASTSIVCGGAIVDDSVALGDNTIIMPGAVIEAGCQLGEGNTVWSNATICHDTRLGHHNFVAANAVIGGNARIGDACFLGFSSVVLQRVWVADETLLGALSLLSSNTAAAGRYVGQPAERVGSHETCGIEISDPGN